MILYCYGTRPEYIKIKKLISLSDTIDYRVLYVEQHKDLIVADYDFKITIEESKNRLNSIISSVTKQFSEIDNIDYVLVQGDTATAFAIALSAKNSNIKVIHLESGLRTYDYDNPYPEEMYRQLISRIADIHFCPTELNHKNLIGEKVQGDKFIVGNTVLDNLTKDGIEYNDEILITLHRRENHQNMDEWFNEINKLASKYPEFKFILPIHPNPNVTKHKDLLTKVYVINPLNHDEFINKLKKCRLVISDSGGIQEEASYLNKKVIVCRKVTERVESLSTNSFLCQSPKELETIFNSHINDYTCDYESPYGDGKSSEKIIEILKKIQ